MIELFNQDCMEGMKKYPDGHFEIAILDVPYSNDYDSMKQISVSNKGKAGNYHYDHLTNSMPTSEYWKEVKRVSKHQIVWGANYLIDHLSPTPCVIVWDKQNTGNFADCEIAFGTFKTGAKIFRYRWNGMIQQDMKNKEERIHVTQKPVALYTYLLKTFAKKGDRILDTHVGSASIALAVDSVNKIEKMDLSLTAFEIDEIHYANALKRIKLHTAQLTI